MMKQMDSSEGCRCAASIVEALDRVEMEGMTLIGLNGRRAVAISEKYLLLLMDLARRCLESRRD